MKWSHIILEAFCLRKCDPRKGKYVYEIIDEETMKTRRVPNPQYDPDFKTPRKPSYCPNIPSYTCLDKGCPHLAFSDAEEADYKWLDKRYKDKK